MNIYGLKGLIKALEQENSPANKYLIQFYNDLYQEQLQGIANQVVKKLDQDQEKRNKKSWDEFLAK
jgi:hypothetical protein